MRPNEAASAVTRQLVVGTALILGFGVVAQAAAAFVRTDRPWQVSAAMSGTYLIAMLIVVFFGMKLRLWMLFGAIPFMGLMLAWAAIASDSDVVGILNAAIYAVLGAFVGWFYGVSRAWRAYAIVYGAFGLAVDAFVVMTSSAPLEVGWSTVIVLSMGVGLCLTLVRLRRREFRALTTDALTGALNRRGLEGYLAELSRGRVPSPGSGHAVVAVDLDWLKVTNDTEGHAAGDARLVEFVAMWRSRIRNTDGLARTGGDEFVIVLPLTDEKTASAVVDRALQNTGFEFSAGIATFDNFDDFGEALRLADERLYSLRQARRSASSEHDWNL